MCNLKVRVVKGVSMDKYKEDIIAISDAIFDLNEVEFETLESAKLISDYLEKEGFRVEYQSDILKAAFVATYGEEKPVVAILGEYDALDGLGHACGHNLLGTGALAAVLQVRDQMKGQGTIVYMGCPAEESGYGKSYMVKQGLFDDVDVALTWHPHYKTEVWSRPSLAVQQTFYHFTGVASHAALAPEKGRSALDGAELMNIGVNYLREHVSDDVRLHYAYLDVGGQSANIVQASASLSYFVRAKDQETLDLVQKRVDDIAKGAALMSGIEVEYSRASACQAFKANKVISNLFKEVLEIEEACDFDRVEAVSTDVGDVSQVIPVAQVFIACEPYPYPMHSQEWVANGKSKMAHDGIFKAGDVLAKVALRIIEEEGLVEKIYAETI